MRMRQIKRTKFTQKILPKKKKTATDEWMPVADILIQSPNPTTLWPQHIMIASFEGVTSLKSWEQLF